MWSLCLFIGLNITKMWSTKNNLICTIKEFEIEPSYIPINVYVLVAQFVRPALRVRTFLGSGTNSLILNSQNFAKKVWVLASTLSKNVGGKHPQHPSKIIFSEKSLSVHMSVCLSVCLSVCPVCPVPSRPPKKVTETENFAKQSCQIYFKGDKNTQSSCGAGRGEAELRIFDFKTTLQSFITSPESVPSSCVR